MHDFNSFFGVLAVAFRMFDSDDSGRLEEVRHYSAALRCTAKLLLLRIARVQ